MKNLKDGRVSVLLSLHDVTPAYSREISEILADLKSSAISAVNLAVVPLFHQNFLLTADPAFCRSLQGLQKNFRTEFLLHGFYHQRTDDVGRRHPLRRLKSGIQSASEDEFFMLPGAEAEERTRRGISIFQEAFGENPRGFLPPAWALGKGFSRILGNFGFSYTENHLFIIRPQTGRKTFSPVIGFSTRSPVRQTLSLAWAHLLRNAPRKAGPLRFAIHPCDYRSGKTRAAVQSTLDRLSRRADWSLYREIF